MKNSGSEKKISEMDRGKMMAVAGSREGQELKKALEKSGGSVDELKAAFGSGDMEKTKNIMQRLMADEKCAEAFRRLEEKFSGK